MSLERIRLLLDRFRARLGALSPVAPGADGLPSALSRELLESMLLARHLDAAAHELRAQGHGHYTICSSGHEANAVLGRLTGPSDPSLLHYRSAALQIERARGVAGVDPVRDIARSLVAARDEPTSGGRHKVFGHAALGIIPQTSTIASHLPRALGLAFALDRKARLPEVNRADAERAKDAIVLASFGDASVNHSTAQGAFNAVSLLTHQNLPLPLLWVCEDNGLGISVRTPPGWLDERFRAMPHVRTFSCDGTRLGETYRSAESAVSYVRKARRPALLHMRCERLLGHAGSDVDTAYRPPQEIAALFERDPVLCAALEAVHSGALSAAEILELEHAVSERVAAEAEHAIRAAKLTTRGQVMSALERPTPPALLESSEQAPSPEPLTLAQGINKVLAELLTLDPGALVFGEDVAKKGGVYGVSKGLFERFGALRVWNTLLDEQTILGAALGAGTLGLLPIPEIQYLAYLHNAEDQLRGEAASMQFFSDGKYENPMMLRIAGLGYQKGFGGHFHNDNSLAVLRDIPSLVVGVPARADDALAMYRTAHALCRQAGRVVVMVEPIALYHRRDLALDGDAQWLAGDPRGRAAFGRARVYRAQGRDLTIASYGNGLALSLAAAARLEREHGLSARVLDLRWIAPLPIVDVLTHGLATGRLLVVDECRRSGNVSEALAAAVLDARAALSFSRVTSADSFIPLGDAANLVLLGEAEVVDAALALCR